LLILNYNELDQKTREEKKKKKRKKVMTACYHRLLHNTTTIEEGNDIDVVTFFTTKPSKNVTIVAITFFCNKAIKEGDRSCHHRPLLLKHREKGNSNKLPSPSSLQHHQRRRQRQQLLLPSSSL
jgi:hypothetical protein